MTEGGVLIGTPPSGTPDRIRTGATAVPDMTEGGVLIGTPPSGTPDRIRTGATAVRGRRARPLHNGGKHVNTRVETLAKCSGCTKSRSWGPGGGGVDFARPPRRTVLDHRC